MVHGSLTSRQPTHFSLRFRRRKEAEMKELGPEQVIKELITGLCIGLVIGLAGGWLAGIILNVPGADGPIFGLITGCQLSKL